MTLHHDRGVVDGQLAMQGFIADEAMTTSHRQRILAYRCGTNLVMSALTGNYKGDQVHVPAILERLGN